MTGREPRWLRRLVVDEAHFQQVRAHGGSHGMDDENALEAAQARPRHRWSYSPGVGLTASNGDAHLAVLAVAARDMTETELIDWIDAHSRTS